RCKAPALADDYQHGVDHLCLWFQSLRRAVAAAILPRPVLGPVSAIRSPGLLEPSCANRLWKRVEEHLAGRAPVRFRSSPKPFALCAYVCWWRHLGRCLSTTAESFRARTLTRSRFDNRRAFCPSSMDEQSARGL